MFVFHLSLSFISLGSFAESRFVSFCPHNLRKMNDIAVSGGHMGVGLGISSIASPSVGDRKKGHPKRQALCELIFGLGSLPY